MHVRNKLLDNDLPRRLDYAQWILQRNVRFVDDIVFGAFSFASFGADVLMLPGRGPYSFRLQGQTHHFIPSLHPNNDARRKYGQVYILDSAEAMQTAEEQSCYLHGFLLVGPYFYNSNLNALEYLDLINNWIVPRLQETHGNRINRTWWIEDGAPAHRTVAVREKLNELFGNRIFALNHRIEWPPRLPDLMPCDFFLWGHLKNKVYSSPLRDIDELKQRIENEANLLQDDAFVRQMIVGMRRRMQLCIEKNGGHTEGNEQ
ncbi:hypothetical protein FHG87_018919 [Trinorchestia longiramus]|nr:hypothetical protein FHG87_018919 [Trinorchestia longiramus]